MKRCAWSESSDLYRQYHDREWGVAVHDDRLLFEFLILEGAQAGLSWSTILNKRDNYRQAFDGFDPETVATYSEGKIEELLQNPGIIRNRLKIKAAITNARQFLQVQQEFGSFDRYIWSFVKDRTIVNSWEQLSDVPVSTPESVAMSRDLKKRGFSFVGETICYAYMQAVGMVNDHLVDCFRYAEVNDSTSGG
ncbi:MAG: DNA-3-methyladenine glycosylase I [Desulfuromonadales bacterium]|nr:DNA-3-methyladenine glycosylase I [Desulfuromonadales bacterium]